MVAEQEFDLDSWDYKITGDGLDWRIRWELPLGLAMVAHVSFAQVSYTEPDVMRGDAYGIQFTKTTTTGAASADGGKVTNVVVIGHGMTRPCPWSEAAKETVIAKVAEFAEERKINEEETP